jgi:NAD(P)-dependent dehydrogenase (short-subunit alcohol dehydrogenase family)
MAFPFSSLDYSKRRRGAMDGPTDRVFRPFDVIDKASPVSWWKDFEINVKGTFLMTAGFLRLAKESHLALPTIVNLTTNVSLTPPSLSSYFTSKIAVVKFTEFIAVENPEVVAYSLSPGIVNTDMTLDSFKPFAKDSRELTTFSFCIFRLPKFISNCH